METPRKTSDPEEKDPFATPPDTEDKKPRRTRFDKVFKIEDIYNTVGKMDAAEVRTTIPDEFFRSVLASIRVLSEFGLKNAINAEARGEAAKFFITSLGDEKLMKAISQLTSSSTDKKAEKPSWEFDQGDGERKRGPGRPTKLHTEPK